MSKLRLILAWLCWLIGGLLATLICSARAFPAEPSIWAPENQRPVVIAAPQQAGDTINIDTDPGETNRRIRVMPQIGPTRPFRPGGVFVAARNSNALPAVVTAPQPPQINYSLPPVMITPDPAGSNYPMGITFPDNSPNTWNPCETDGVVILPDLPSTKDPCNERHSGALQRFELTGTYLPRFNQTDGLGISEADALLEIGMPFPTLDVPLLISPESEVRWFDGPVQGGDLPPQVYDEYIDFRWFIHMGSHWIADLSVTPGIHTDWDNISRDAWRFPWHAVAVYQQDEYTFFALGIADLDRQDYRYFPVGGVIFNLNPDTKFELVTPRPKISRKINTLGTPGCVHSQDWIYIAAEFGGGEWAIQRAAGGDDVVDMHDTRVILGLERKNCQGLLSGRVEMGYVFARKLEYHDGSPDLDLSETLMARAGFWY